jgi:hypothetical protein
LDRIGTERFGEASGRSNGPFEKKDQKSVKEKTIFGDKVEDIIDSRGWAIYREDRSQTAE